MVKAGPHIVLTRERGTILTPKMLSWRLPPGAAIGQLLVNGEETSFENDNGLLTAPLPPMGAALRISLEVAAPPL